MTKRSFEDLVTAGMELGRAEQLRYWEWEKLVDAVDAFGDEALKDYAEDVGMEYETLKRYRNESGQTRLKF